ncbi:General amino acid permease AGP3 [Ceratocystis fimbriata CBS 114723]|uniref:General amino acid permease AGP3 n=1 Tax=Ceratocystis fimbriata CBS 114723 TaxID=1035309 RepID=A0A2C5XB92_9PEZI|nr:General amino acid permease AGP3 [Ceratocystis fimbriata CBS 114723]
MSATDDPDHKFLVAPAAEPLSESSAQDFQAIDPHSGVKRGLKTRHLSMMALAGIIGPGLLVGSGGALANGGPAALLIGFGVIGIVAFSIMQSLGEITTLYPSGGAFTSLADRFVDKAFGVAVGWNYFIIWVAVLANEYNTVCSLFSFWSDKVPLWGYFLIFWFAFLAFQLLGVETFGEAEFWLALFKLVGLVAYFLFSIIYVSGGVKGVPAFGFHYWNDPGAFSNGFRGVATVFVFCSTFYAGCESVAVAATETKNPRVAVPLAIRQVFWRIIFVYMGSALFFGLTCPWNAEGLINGSSRALKSPMTIAIQNAGWHGGVHLINAFIFVTCLSAVNSSIFIASRTLLFMAHEGKAPRVLRYTTSRGVPIPAIVLANACGSISMMNISTGAAKAYSYIVNLSGVSTFLVWGSIAFIHIRFRQAWAVQGHSPDELPFRAMWYPYNAYFGLCANIFLAFVQGWATLSPFKAGDFVDAYILLPLFPLIFVLSKYFMKTHFWRLDEIDLASGQRRDLEETMEVEPGQTAPKKTIWERLWTSF